MQQHYKQAARRKRVGRLLFGVGVALMVIGIFMLIAVGASPGVRVAGAVTTALGLVLVLVSTPIRRRSRRADNHNEAVAESFKREMDVLLAELEGAVDRSVGDSLELRDVELVDVESPADSSTTNAVNELMSRELAAASGDAARGRAGGSRQGAVDELQALGELELTLGDRTRDRVIAGTRVLDLRVAGESSPRRVVLIPHAAMSSWVQDVIEQVAALYGGEDLIMGQALRDYAPLIPRRYSAIDVVQAIEEFASAAREGREVGSSITVRAVRSRGSLVATAIWIGDQPGRQLFAPSLPQQYSDAVALALRNPAKASQDGKALAK